MSIPESLWNNLKWLVKDFSKKVQLSVDYLSGDPAGDNSSWYYTPPYEFDGNMIFSTRVRDIIDGYTDSTHGQGYQQFVYRVRVNVSFNHLRLLNLQYLGQGNDTSPFLWSKLSNDDLATINAAREAMYTEGSVYVDNQYEDIYDLIVSYRNAQPIKFKPALHDNTDLKLTFPSVNGDVINNGFTIGLGTAALDTNEDGYIIPKNQSGITSIQHNMYYGDPLIAIMQDDTDCQQLANSLLSAHHEILNATSQGSYKVYYGDNYIIYSMPESTKINYNDLRSSTNTAISNINSWFPDNPPIEFPTYEENKHEDDPPIDDDIEVEMNLNDAAFGEGLSHYYVTTVDAPVLSDISAAMSSWNINNTGKDLYRNLLSCRITKVGPIPAENSTFVIYGEELQYNGSPISINKITGNPSMDLGEYEILPKFNDFRDYAPYTKIEMFIPYCGWVALPSHCMSSEESPKIITGTLLCDIIAGTCKAVIKCNDTVVAEASGFTAVDVPFTGENVGMKMAGIASAITSYGNTASKTVGNIASGGMSGGAGAGASAAGGLVGLLGSYAQLHSAFNANYTEICGKTGDGCNVAGLNKVYIKIQRPKTGGYEAPDFVPDDYGHTTGFIAMKKKQISECEGLIVCANPDTSGIGGATDRERQMIKNLLESGIIVRQTEPEP